MHVLFITQRVDSSHDVLGFTTDWISALADRVEHVSVLAGYVGEFNLQNNVRIHSYGKEKGYSKWRRMAAFQSRCKAISKKQQVDVVFSHMIPKYTIASWPWFGLRGVPYVQWYAHKSVTWDLHLAHFLADRVLTPTTESIRIDSDKVRVVGHGIDTDRFVPRDGESNRTQLLGVGRTDPVKRFEVLIDAVHTLSNRGFEVSLRIVGDASSDEEYQSLIRERVAELELEGYVEFVGSIPNEAIVREYQDAGVFLNASETGSLDKTEIEALACGTPTISCNTSYSQMVQEQNLSPSLLTYPSGDQTVLADRIERVISLDRGEYESLCLRCRKAVVDSHGVRTLMDGISRQCREVAGS